MSSSSNASNDDIRNKWPRLLACRKYSTNDLEKAVEESRFGTSPSHLSKKYNIPRTTIINHRDNESRRPRADAKYSASDLDKAAQDYGAGMSVNNASIMYNIPQATIYKHLRKNNLKRTSEDISMKAREWYHDAVLKTWPELAGRRRYLASDLDNAIEACKAGSTYREAAIIYNVPKTTICAHRKKIEQIEP